MQNKRIERLAEYLCSEFDFNLNPCVGYSWPEHEKDDGYRGDGSSVKLQPSDVQAYARENAKRILAFLEREAALSAAEPTRCEGCDGYNCDDGCAYPTPASKPAPSVAVKVPPMPETEDRRPLDDDNPDGYLESNSDWADNNNDAVEWLADNHAAIRSALSAQVQDVADSELAYKEARQLAVSLHAEHYRDVTQWRPLDDLRGVISQIDNMVCGLVVKPEGWQIVPKEPTPEMVVAAKSTTSAVLTKSHATEIYSAMLAAAPAKQEG